MRGVRFGIAVAILLAVFSGACGEEIWGRISTPSITPKEDFSVFQTLDMVAIATGSNLYFEVNSKTKQGLMGVPKAQIRTVLRRGSLDFVLGQLQTAVARHLLLSTDGPVVVAVPTAPGPLTAKVIDFDFKGTTRELVGILYKEGAIAPIQKEGIQDSHIGDFERMRITGDRRGRVKGRMTIRAALLRFIQSANLNVIVTIGEDRSVDFYFSQVIPSALRQRTKSLESLRTSIAASRANLDSLQEPGNAPQKER